MRSIFKSKVFWFFLGMSFFRIIFLIVGLFTTPSAKDAMPFNSYFEESRSECFLPADYGYTLKSKIKDMSLFEKFVDDMDMRDHKVGDYRYEDISSNGERGTTITYEEGMIVYHEYAN